jgi:malonyl-CoA/methylmalonyl-CoA synthetase
MQDNFYVLLQSRFAGRRDRPCLITPVRQWSYGEIGVASAGFARALKEAGVAAGDRVAVQVEKSPHAVALYLACLRIGAVFVPLNTAYTPVEVGYFLADAAPRIFVCRPEDEVVHADAARDAGAAVLTLDTNGKGTLATRISLGAADDAIAPRAADDVAVILYTSGTTGRSKGAMLTHRNLASNALTLFDYWGWRDDDVLLHALPIFHIHGLFVALHTAMLGASPMLFLPKFDVAALRAALPRATVMMGVPTFYTRLLDEPDFGMAECKHMRLFICGSAPLTAAAHRAFQERTGHAILERFGMSEAGMIASNPLNGERIAGTVGYPLPGISVRVRGEAGRVVIDETGMIEVKGPNVFKGYWRLPEKTAEEFTEDGFFITGDLGVQAIDGRLAIVGRGKDLIISGGYNIYPKEIEAVLDDFDGVVESAVIGVPHRDFGEGVIAVLATAGGAPVDEARVRAALEGQLARFKHPKIFVAVKELPRNTMGKVQKNVLRDAYRDAFSPLGATGAAKT